MSEIAVPASEGLVADNAAEAASPTTKDSHPSVVIATDKAVEIIATPEQTDKAAALPSWADLCSTPTADSIAKIQPDAAADTGADVSKGLPNNRSFGR